MRTTLRLATQKHLVATEDRAHQGVAASCLLCVSVCWLVSFLPSRRLNLTCQWALGWPFSMPFDCP